MRREDDFTSTVDGAAAHARVLGMDEPHPFDCRCHPCIVDEFDPAEEQ